MIYVYKCEKCEIDSEIEKPMAQSDRVEYCLFCGGILKRIYESVGIVTSDGIKNTNVEVKK